MSSTYEHVIDTVDDYLHGLLSAEQSEALEQHCEQCPICEVALREARKRFAAMQAVPPVEASEALIVGTLKRVEQAQAAEGRRWRRWRRYGLMPVAASIVILAGLHIYYANRQPSPYDLKLVGQQELVAGAPAALRVQLSRRDRDQSVAGVPVTVELARGQEVVRLASFTTDAQGAGQVRFRVPEWAGTNCEIRAVARTPDGPDSLSRTVAVKRSWQLMLSTDKPVYQPGQVIRMRSLSLRKLDLVPVAGNECTFAAADPKGNVVFKHKAVTSLHGIASADFQLADEIIEGDYAITCRVGDSESKATVTVKKYTLPKFKIDVQLNRPFYAPGERLSGTVQAAYFFGKPVAGGQVRIEAKSADVTAQGIGPVSAVTDEAGHASFQLTLPTQMVGLEQESGNAIVTLDVKVSDAAGQEESKRLSRTVTASPLRIQAIPESGQLVRGVPNTIYLLTSYADGQPARTSLAVTGQAGGIDTDEQGLAAIEVTPNADQISLTISARDAKGLSANRTVTLNCGKAANDYLLRLDRAVYRGGQSATLTIVGGGNEPVFVDFLRDGQIALTTVVPVSNGQGTIQLDLPPELFGTVQVHSYRFGRAGLANRRTRVIYIEQARQLAVSASLDRPEYRPGEQATLQIELKDDQSRPAPGAISLAAVDEAVFSVLAQRPGMEQAFFTLEQQLLEPVYAIYPWSPDLTTSIGDPARRDLLNQALFASTAETLSAQRDQLERLVQEGVISPRTLEVLDSEYLEWALEHRDVSPEVRRAVEGDLGTMFAAVSYGAKQRQFERSRSEAMETFEALWWMVGLVGAAVLIGGLFMWLRSALLNIVLGIAVVLLLISILLPSLARAREFSPPSMAARQLMDLERGIELEELPRLSAMAVEYLEYQPRVREWFPETLLWRPEIVTDDQGRVSLEVPLADSITTWRLTGSAVTRQGQLGALQSSIRVFQPFFVDLNLPVSLTRGDEVSVPVVVYNYLDKPQVVSLTLEPADWFTTADQAKQQVSLQPGDVRSVSYRIRAARPGRHHLQVTASAGGVADAVKREIEVIPEGRRIEQTFSGSLAAPADLDLTLPPEVVPDSTRTTLRLYPSSFSQVAEGLDAIFQMPYGCFEQTSSTTYPNVLALDYLRATKTAAPQVEAKARQFINLGYQRLLTFEVEGGGFDWFGRSPANQTLSAYGLMEFTDMARVHDVDPALIARTRTWLLSKRLGDGSWPAENHGMHEDPLGGSGQQAQLAATAYAAWAVFSDPKADADPAPTLNYISGFKAAEIDSPYLLALVSNALLAMDAKGTAARPYLERLASLAKTSPDGKLAWWQQGQAARTTFYGSGRAGDIETTALAALAQMKAGTQAQQVRGALAWLITQKDAVGTWHSTQATVLALKALLAGTGKPLGGGQARRIRVTCGQAEPLEITIPADQDEVVKQVDLTQQVAAAGPHVRIEDLGGAAVNYQLVSRYHMPADGAREAAEPLAIQIQYGSTDLAVGDRLAATATITNNMASAAPMVILDLPVPPGFAADPRDFTQAVTAGSIAKFEITPRQVIVYLRGLEPGKLLTVKYGLQATMPVEVTAPSARAYEYYNPDRQGQSQPVRITVRPRA